MLNKGQQTQYIAFVANFVQQLHKAGIERATAEKVASLAAATMLGAVLHVMPDYDKRLEDFAAKTIMEAITMFYGVKEA